LHKDVQYPGVNLRLRNFNLYNKYDIFVGAEPPFGDTQTGIAASGCGSYIQTTNLDAFGSA